MVHPQSPTPMMTDNRTENIIVNGTAKQTNIQSNRHDILLVMQQNTTKLFPHILGRGKEKPGRLCHKTPPNMTS